LRSLLLNSKAAKYLAVRQVTQLNQGKATAGVDGKTALNCKERMQLTQDLLTGWKKWEHRKLRRVNIPKKDGTQRKLGIPTIGDRAYQCLLKYALEPAAEATFHGNSYGFRPVRGTQDVQKRLFTALNSQGRGITKTILEMDIEKCFDQISHETILEKTELPKIALKGLRLAIKAGVRGEFPTSTAGTQQGSVISPLLANIALNGIEEVTDGIYKRINHKVLCLRYADDLVFICKPEHNIALVKEQASKFLEERGLKIKESKTHVVKSTDGFDFRWVELQSKTQRKIHQHSI
jgi:RNA-directed DNA polymerase